MKPERNIIEVDDTTQGVDVVMGVAEGAMNKIAGILTDMYPDPGLAFIRELSCNAWDSHIAAGQTRPIEVTVGKQGSQLSLPVCVIEDFGLGLNEDEVTRIYSQYGATTKDQSDDFVGMLGIGSKSPLSYTDQFTVQAAKDGHQIIVAATRDDNGALTMTILDGGSTDRPNGVRVEVPVKANDTELLHKAERIFGFWERGTVLLNGEEPTPFWEADEAVDITDSITVVPSAVLPDSSKDYVVMGGIGYPTDFGFYRQVYSDSRSIIARIGVGGVSFTPNREELMETERTKATLTNIKHEFKAAARRLVQDAVDSATTHGEALHEFVRTRQALPSNAQPPATSLLYQGEALPDFPELFGATSLNSAGYKYSTGKRTPALDTIATGIWVTNFDNDNFTGSQREKLKLYIAHNRDADFPGPGQRALYLVKGDVLPHDKWVPPNHRIDWPDVRKWKVPGGVAVAGFGTKVITGSYWGHLPHQPGVVEVDASTLKQDSHLFYRQCGKYEGSNTRDLLRAEDKDAVLICLSANRVEKFKRDFPKAQDSRDGLKKFTEKKVKKLTGDERIALRLPGESSDFSDLFPRLNDIDDPELRRAVELSNLWEKKYSKLQPLKDQAHRRGVDLKLDQVDASWISATFKRYPLVTAGYERKLVDDLIIYVNAAYTQKGANA